MHNRLKRMLIQALTCNWIHILRSVTQDTGSVRVHCPVVTHCPELYEILQYGGCNEQTVHQRVGQEEDEKLVVGESDTVVHPGGTQTRERSDLTSGSDLINLNFQRKVEALCGYTQAGVDCLLAFLYLVNQGTRTRSMWIIKRVFTSFGNV